MLPDLNRLKVFFHIFNEQSSTAAALKLHITQSGVSQHLKKTGRRVADATIYKSKPQTRTNSSRKEIYMELCRNS